MQVVNLYELEELIDCLYEKAKTRSERKAYDEVINLAYDIAHEEGEEIVDE